MANLAPHDLRSYAERRIMPYAACGISGDHALAYVWRPEANRNRSSSSSATYWFKRLSQLEVSYAYVPVPEPSHLTLELLAMGLAAKLIRKKRRDA